MFWILVTTAFLVVFGGILMVLPSKSERNIGRMRIDARKYGLQTQGIVVSDVNAPAVERVTAGGRTRNPKVQCIAWQKRYEDEYSNIPTWTLYKSTKEEGPVEGYIIEPQMNEVGLEQQVEYWKRVGKAIEQLPDKVVGVKSDSHGVSWIGQERLVSTPQEFIRQMLDGLEDLSEVNRELALGRLSE